MEYSNKDALVSGFKFVSCGGGRIRFAMAIEGSYTRFDFGSVEISEVSRNR